MESFFTPKQEAFIEKGERLIHQHRAKVFDPITGDAHRRAIRRLQAILQPYWRFRVARLQERRMDVWYL